MPGYRTILSINDFSKTFDSVWNPTLFHKLISAGLSTCFACWAQPFLSDRRACVVYQNHKSRFFRVGRSVPQGYVLGLSIWSSSPSVPTAVGTTQGALIRLDCWSEYWRLSLNPRQCEASFFAVDLHQANL